MKISLNKKTLKMGAIATTLTVIGVAVILVVNMIATTVVDRFGLRVDLTDAKTFTMTDTTKGYLADMTVGVDIYVMLDEVYFTQTSDASYKHVKYLLDQYELNSSGNVSVTYDSKLINDSAFINKFDYIRLAAGDVVVVSQKQPEGGKVTNYRKFSLEDCFDTTQYQTGTTTYYYDISKVENNLTASILYLNQDDTTLVSFTTGHGEADLSESATSLIKSNVYSTSSVNLAMLSSLDDGKSAAETFADISVLIIYCPVTDFSADELNMLDIYLENGEEMGKSLMVFYDPTTPHLPNLEEFLYEWGVTVEDGILYDEERNYLRSGTVPRVMIPEEMYADAEIISSELYNDVYNAKVNLCAPVARPLSVRAGYTLEEGGQNSIVTYTALSTFNSSGIMQTSTSEISDSDKTGAFPVATLSVKTRILNNQPRTSCVAVCGTGSLVDDTMLTDSIFCNDRYFVETLNFLAHRKTGVVVSAVDVTTATIDATETQIRILMILFQFLLPAVALIAGVIVFIRRRHL